MFIILKSKGSKAMDEFVEEFVRPKVLNKAMIQSMIFVEKKVDRIDDLIILRQKALFDYPAKQTFIIAFATALFGVFMNWSWLVNASLSLLVMSGALISPLIWFITIRIRLFIIGHRGKVELMSKNYLLEKLFYERDSNVSE